MRSRGTAVNQYITLSLSLSHSLSFFSPFFTDEVSRGDLLCLAPKELEKNAPPKIKLFVVANKTDLVEKELVKLDKGKEFAEKNNGVFKLTSAKDNLGINELFTEISIAVDKKPTLHEDTQQKTISGRASLHKKKEKCC